MGAIAEVTVATEDIKKEIAEWCKSHPRFIRQCFEAQLLPEAETQLALAYDICCKASSWSRMDKSTYDGVIERTFIIKGSVHAKYGIPVLSDISAYVVELPDGKTRLSVELD